MTTILLTNSSEVGLIDSIYFEEVSKHNWQLINGKEGNKYIGTELHGKTLYLHVLIALLSKLPNLFPGILVDIDHIDNNGLNCQVYNLRYIPHSENTRRGMFKNNPDKNIWHRKDNGKYRVKFIVNKKGIDVGQFDTIEEARIARDSFIRSQNLITN